MHASVPISDEDLTLFGMTWAEILRLRDTRAKVYEHKFRYQVSLEKFLSVANLTITVALTKYVPRVNNPSKLSPVLRATLRRLANERIPKTAIARRLGCGRFTIYDALRQEDIVCHAPAM